MAQLGLPGYRLDLAEDDHFSSLPPSRYESELMHGIAWAIHDYLQGEEEFEVVEDCLAEVEEKFSVIEAEVEAIEHKLSELVLDNPEESHLKQAKYFGIKGIELFQQGLDDLNDALSEEAEDQKVWDGLRTLLDGNDYLTHCFLLLAGKIEQPCAPSSHAVDVGAP